MLKEIGKVIEVEEKEIKVEFEKQEACGCCRISSFCMKSGEIFTIQNPSFMNIQKGDKIEVGIEEKTNIAAIILLFLVPIVLLIIMLALFQSYGEIKSFLAALLTVIIYYAIIRVIINKHKDKFELKILKKL